MGESEKVEGRRLAAPSTLTRPTRTPTVDQPCLFRVQTKTESPKSLRQHLRHPSCIGLVSKYDDEVVRIPDQVGRLPHPRLDLLDKPAIQHLVQVDIRQQRRNHSSLRGAGLGSPKLPVFEHPRSQPLVDHLSNHTIAHPLV